MHNYRGATLSRVVVESLDRATSDKIATNWLMSADDATRSGSTGGVTAAQWV